ncbi:MAG: hypothetical protein GXO46_11265 [Chlorobi bacterium]|nr:hypothetical protein [Chlorobiota bacterium]
MNFNNPDGRKAFAPEPVKDNIPRGGLVDFYSRGGNGSYNEFLGKDMLLFYKGANGAYGGGGSSPTFQFPKGTEEYYKKNYTRSRGFVTMSNNKESTALRWVLCFKNLKEIKQTLISISYLFYFMLINIS